MNSRPTGSAENHGTTSGHIEKQGVSYTAQKVASNIPLTSTAGNLVLIEEILANHSERRRLWPASLFKWRTVCDLLNYMLGLLGLAWISNLGRPLFGLT